MSGPEQAATVTPGQAAYEAYAMAAPDEIDFTEPGDLPDWERGAWEAAAKAAVPGYRMLVDEALAERDRLTERVAELVTEGNDLGRQLARAVNLVAVILDWFTPIGDANSHRATVSTAQLAQWRRQAGISTPAVVTAGTEHLAEKIRGLAIPDEDTP